MEIERGCVLEIVSERSRELVACCEFRNVKHVLAIAE